MSRSRRAVVWRFVDGKAGHERQTEGLVAALTERVACASHDVRVPDRDAAGLRARLKQVAARTAMLPAPDLVVGAGSVCQWPMLAARRRHGGRAVYLMRPGLPARCFDLCLVPRHDGARDGGRVVVTEGPLNPVRASAAHDPARGLVLVGGPSAHHDFDAAQTVAEVVRIAGRRPDIAWEVADSRRTPASFRALLARRDAPGLSFVPHEQTTPDWLPSALARAGTVWVTADSVAMLFEALTSGAGVGVVDVPRRRHDRITAIADDLEARGLVARPAQWLAHGTIDAPASRPDEARRCAGLLIERWPELLGGGDGP